MMAPGRRLACVAAISLLVTPACSPAGPRPSSPGPASGDLLRRTEQSTEAGRYAEARRMLRQWFQAQRVSPRPAPTAEQARALLLRARLAMDPDSAHAAYTSVITRYPASDQAGFALLRLAQLVSDDDPPLAVAYAERYLREHPGHEDRRRGWLWLARLRGENGATAEACSTARRALESTAAADPVGDALRVERDRFCPEPTPDPRTEEGVAPQPAEPPAPEPEAATPTPDRGRYTVQAGAFRQLENARALMARLQRAGFTARLVRLPANDLLRVRLDHFENPAAAARLARRLHDAGFAAVVTGDAPAERQP